MWLSCLLAFFEAWDEIFCHPRLCFTSSAWRKLSHQCVMFSIWAELEHHGGEAVRQEVPGESEAVTCTSSLPLPSIIIVGCTRWKWCDNHIAWSWTHPKAAHYERQRGLIQCKAITPVTAVAETGAKLTVSSACSQTFYEGSFLFVFMFLHFCRKLLMHTTCVHHFKLSKTSLLIIQTLK